jgi:hypothetical protein
MGVELWNGCVSTPTLTLPLYGGGNVCIGFKVSCDCSTMKFDKT